MLSRLRTQTERLKCCLKTQDIIGNKHCQKDDFPGSCGLPSDSDSQKDDSAGSPDPDSQKDDEALATSILFLTFFTINFFRFEVYFSFSVGFSEETAFRDTS